MAKAKRKPWRRGQRLGPGLIDWDKGTEVGDPSGFACRLCGAHRWGDNSVNIHVQPRPGVSPHREVVICAACRDEFAGKTYCAGCDRQVVSTYDPETKKRRDIFPAGGAWRAHLEVGGRFEVTVCGERRGCSDETSPNLTCKRKAFRDLDLCPGGCGSNAEPGTMCESCWCTLQEGKRQAKAEPMSRSEFRVPAVLARAIAVTAGGRGSGKPHMPSDEDLDRWEHARIVVDVTKTQRDGLYDLVEKLEAWSQAQKDRGFREGHSFLGRLAAGSVSMDELNKAADRG